MCMQVVSDILFAVFNRCSQALSDQAIAHLGDFTSWQRQAAQAGQVLGERPEQDTHPVCRT